MDTNAIAQWAHDIRNTLGTIALHLESLERLGHADAGRILTRSDALLKKAVSMCSDLMREAVHRSAIAPRRRFDVTETIEEVLGLIAPIVPATTTLSLTSSGPVYVSANPKDVFRILFNLIHNAAGVARGAGTMRRIELAVKQNGAIVTIGIADDGPGLPDDIRARLFQHSRSTSGGSGHGLSIARELAERNGAILELVDTVHGTEFSLELPGIDVDARCEVIPMSPTLAVLEAA